MRKSPADIGDALNRASFSNASRARQQQTKPLDIDLTHCWNHWNPSRGKTSSMRPSPPTHQQRGDVHHHCVPCMRLKGWSRD